MLLPTLRVLLVLVVLSAGVRVAYLSVLTAIGCGPGMPEMVFWIGNETGIAAIAMLLLRTGVRCPVR